MTDAQAKSKYPLGKFIGIENAERQRVVEIAKSWLRTPYRHMGRIKGVGCDCATLLAEVYEEAGLIEHVELGYYSPQWHLHRDAEKYLDMVLARAGEVDTPLPGDVVLWKFGRTFSHGAIVVEWPLVIHAYLGSTVTLENAENARWLVTIGENTADRGKPRPRKYLSYWAKNHVIPEKPEHIG